MSEEGKDNRRPQAFSLEDHKVVEQDDSVFDKEQEEASDYSSQDRPVPKVRSNPWFSLLTSAVLGLIVLSFVAWVTSYITALFFRDDILGYLSLGLLGLAAFSAVMLLVYELIALSRLRRLVQYRQEAQSAIDDKSLDRSKKVVASLEKLYGKRDDLQWNFSRFRELRQDVLDADEFMILLEREVISNIDGDAKSLITSSARKVAAITTISPAPLLDVFIVAYMNLSLLRQIAVLYGGRPGLYGSLRLGRMVITHLTLSGGVALTSDIVQQLMGQKLAAKISSKLGEGLFNGMMTARIGIAAMELCRPLPYIKSRKPSLQELAKSMLSPSLKS